MIRLFLIFMFSTLNLYALEYSPFKDSAEIPDSTINTLWQNDLVLMNSVPIKTLHIDALFVQNENSFVTIKMDLKGEIPLNQWIATSEGDLIHLMVHNKIWGVHFVGFSLPDRNALLQELQNHRLTALQKFTSVFMNNAYAQSCYPTTGVLSSHKSNNISAVLGQTVWASVLGCAQGLGEGVWAGTGGLVADTWSLASSVAKEPVKFWNSVTTKTKSFLAGMKKFSQNFIQDPEAALAPFKEALGNQYHAMKKAISAMSPEEITTFICSLVGQIGIDVAITVFTAGAASGKLGITVARAMLKLQKAFALMKRGVGIPLRLLEKMSDALISKMTFLHKKNPAALAKIIKEDKNLDQYMKGGVCALK